ncbi:MAG: N-acetyltransferase [Bergeyella sp.]|nr:N-acetyltransferase [Bergeyella sp.]
MSFNVGIASEEDARHIPDILREMEISAKERGTGIARRTAAYIREKISENKVIIATSGNGEWAGFCYIEIWDDKEYVANSGLIVSRKYRNSGLASLIKEKTFSHSRKYFPKAKIFGLTTGLAVMKINSKLGYVPVTYSELTQDEVFWQGCKTCVNYDILMSKNKKNCMCTAMLFDPELGRNESLRSGNARFFSKLDKIKRLLWKK